MADASVAGGTEWPSIRRLSGQATASHSSTDRRCVCLCSFTPALHAFAVNGDSSLWEMWCWQHSGSNLSLFGRFIRSTSLEANKADDVGFMHALPQKLSKMPCFVYWCTSSQKLHTATQAVRTCSDNCHWLLFAEIRHVVMAARWQWLKHEMSGPSCHFWHEYCRCSDAKHDKETCHHPYTTPILIDSVVLESRTQLRFSFLSANLMSCQCKFSFMWMQWVLGLWEGRLWWVDRWPSALAAIQSSSPAESVTLLLCCVPNRESPVHIASASDDMYAQDTSLSL